MRKNVVEWKNDIFTKTAKSLNGPVWWGKIVARIMKENKVGGFLRYDVKVYSWTFPSGWIPGRPFYSIVYASPEHYRYNSNYSARFDIGPVLDGYQTVNFYAGDDGDLKEVAALYPEDALIAQYPLEGSKGFLDEVIPALRLLTNSAGDCYVLCEYTWIGDKLVACEPEFADLYEKLKARCKLVDYDAVSVS